MICYVNYVPMWFKKTLLVLFFFILYLNGHAQKKDRCQLQIITFQLNNPTNYKLKKNSFYVKDSTEILEKLQNIKDQLVKSGYLSASIDSLTKEHSDYYAYLYIGKLYRWEKLNAAKVNDEAIKVSGINKVNGKIVDFDGFRKRQEKLLDYYVASGYPFVQTHIDSLTIKNSLFNAKLNISKNKKFYFDTIYVKGKVNISKKLIYRYIGIKPSAVLNQGKVDNIDNNLNKLAYLTVAKPTELEFFEGKVDVFVYLKKKKSNFFSGIIGFASNEKENNKLQLTGNISLNLNNSFGIGENINLRWESYKDSSQFLTTGLSFPYLFFLPIGFSAGFQLDKDMLNYLNLNYSLAFSYDVNVENSFQLHFKQSRSFLIDAEPENTASYENTNSYILGLSVAVNKTNRLFVPQRGFNVRLYSGYGNRWAEQSGNSAVIEAGFEAAYYWQLTNYLTFNFKNSSKGIFQDEGFYENEMFKLGGIKSIRGFDEKSILATAYSIFTLEPRFFISDYSFLSVFADYIYFEVDALEQTKINSGYGLGAGISIDIKAGILSLNFAVGKLNDNPFRLSNTKVHFVYVARF